MPKIIDEVWDILSKGGTYIAVTLLAIMGKIGMELMSKKALSGWYIFGFTFLALFVSVMTYLLCEYRHFNPVLSALTVGISTMFSRDIMIAVTMLNWKKISSLNWADVFEILVTKKRK